MRAVAIILALTAFVVGPSAAAQSARIRPDQSLKIRGQDLIVHLAAGTTHADGPMLLYATGDGGWPGEERLFDRMRPWGYPMAGFNSVDYIASIHTPARTVDTETVAADIGAIITTARHGLELPLERPVILVGFSRGAGLASAAAASAPLRARLKGVLLVALTAEEDFVTERVPGTTTGAARELQTYAVLPRLGPLRVALIQSTRDEFVPSAEAQRRFGPEGPSRRFRAIDAKDHSFGGKLAELTAAMRAFVEWIARES